jgi:hypothetical protein
MASQAECTKQAEQLRVFLVVMAVSVNTITVALGPDRHFDQVKRRCPVRSVRERIRRIVRDEDWRMLQDFTAIRLTIHRA